MLRCVVVIVVFIGVSNAQNNPAAPAATAAFPDTTKWSPLTCRPSGVFLPNDERMAEIHACKLMQECVFLCQMKALGLLNAKGLPTVKIYDKWVNDVFPTEHKEMATAFFRSCFKSYGQFIDLNDTECKFVKQFGECTWGIVPKLTCPKAA